jgi:hypothetical protein
MKVHVTLVHHRQQRWVFLHHRQQRGWLVFKYRYPWKRKLQFGWNKLMNDKYLIVFIYKKKTQKKTHKNCLLP